MTGKDEGIGAVEPLRGKMSNVVHSQRLDGSLIEDRLLRQATELHAQGLRLLEFAGSFESLRMRDSPMRDSLMSQAIKLLRLHNETVDTLGRYRRNGEQKVVVQYVNVQNGGQATVGAVIQ